MLRPADTSPEAWEVYLARLRSASATEKLQLLSDWYEFLRALRFAGLRAQYPDATPEKIEQLFLQEILHRSPAT